MRNQTANPLVFYGENDDFTLKNVERVQMGILGKIFGKTPKPGKPAPVTDETFERDVINSEMPVLVDFWAPWCAPCRVMGGLLDEVGPEYVDKVKLMKLNVDQNPQTAAQFGVRSIPTMIAFKKGKAVERITGLLPLNPLRQKLNRLAG